MNSNVAVYVLVRGPVKDRLLATMTNAKQITSGVKRVPFVSGNGLQGGSI